MGERTRNINGIQKVMLLLAFIFLALDAYVAQDINEQFINQLTPDEKAWLQENPKITYTGNLNWLPFEGFDQNRQHIGIAAEYLANVQALTGLEIEFLLPKDWLEALEFARDERVQMITAVDIHPRLNQNFTPVSSYYVNRVALVTRSSETDVKKLELFTNKKIGLIKGYAFPEQVRSSYPDLDFIDIENADTALAMISNNELDGVMLYRSEAEYKLLKDGYSDLKIMLSTGIRYGVTFFVSEKKPYLSSIVDKALKAIPETEQFKILSNWSNNIETGLHVELSLQEREYLKSISPIKFTGDPDWLPNEAFTEDGSYIGVVADHLDLIEDMLGVKLTKIPTASWTESVDLARSGQVDILSETDTSDLKESMAFTRSYTSSPLVVVMSNKQNYIRDVNELKSKKIAVIKDYGYVVDVKKTYPDINFLETDSVQQGLLQVSTGEFDAFICNSSQAIYHIKRLGLDNIKIVGRTEIETHLSFAINPDKAALVPILNKALDEIYLSPQQQEIFDQWSDVTEIEQVDNSLLFKMLGLALAVVLLALYGNYRLRRALTRRKKIQRELSKAKEQANAANEAKSKFLAVMSHELRTPLNGILGMLELHQKSDLSVEQRNTVRIVRESSESLLEILNDILDYSKIEAEKMDLILEPSNLRNLLEICVNAQAQNAYKKGLSLEVFLAPDFDHELEVDSVRIRQIINNLLSNAIKFTSEGTVTVSLTQLEDQGDGCVFVIEIEDSGVGISEEDQAKLFNEFVQVDMATNRKQKGTGLGLSICKKLSDLMGGALSLSSKYGVGTAFRYTQFAKYSKTPEPQTKRWADLFVGIITDNSFTYKVLESYLRYYGAETFTPRITPVDSKALLQLTQENNIDLMIMDQSLVDDRFKDYSELTKTHYMKLIKLVNERTMSANNVISNIGILNTNPLQPRYLELLVDLSLGNSPYSTFEHETNDALISPSNARLLVVEDHPTNRELVSRQLQHLNIAFEIVEDGQLGLEAWQAGNFSGILTDCHMPNMDGYEMVEHIRALGNKEAPIIAMTANAMGGEKEKCLKAGMNDLLVKPVDMKSLTACLNKWFATEQVVTTPQSVKPAPGDDLQSALKLEQLSEIFFGKENISPMLDSYYQATLDDIKELRTEIQNEDKENIKRVGHRIKGAARLVLAEEIETIAEQIEKYSEELSYSDLSQKSDALEEQLRTYTDIVRASL